MSQYVSGKVSNSHPGHVNQIAVEIIVQISDSVFRTVGLAEKGKMSSCAPGLRRIVVPWRECGLGTTILGIRVVGLARAWILVTLGTVVVAQ